ncbi:MAG: putative zinc-binding metallopeptidase [Dysgonamonadaceae bacterium]|jgi:substrate import-associated zinc metallohydrolase lipoprotein|nr:putative zinc-binding metallopeptidase [Dysgonamonadaceae bacterium]
MKNKYTVLFTAVIFSLLFFTSCREEDEFTDSIFDTTAQGLDKNAFTYRLDSFLYESFSKPYNLQFTYKMQTEGTDLTYNLVPATYTNAKKIAVLTKYLWFDVYDSIAPPYFVAKSTLRIIQLIGSPGYNPYNGTELLGLAEGGMKISLFKVNELNPANVADMNEKFFKTMHHEFAHILHQEKTYPKEFRLISAQHYTPFGWENRHPYVAASLGFVSDYAGSEAREDFVEVIANYIVKTDAEWNNILAAAAAGWEQINSVKPEDGVLSATDSDGVKGDELIKQKLDICRTWLADMWNVNLDSLRAEVQRRQARIDMDSLLLQIE